MPTIRVLRFSLFDLFVITLGVAAGLGYHRVSGVRWTDALLVSCATWIVVGMAQQAQRAYVVRRSLPKADYFNRNGSGFYVARSIAVFLMFAAAIGFEVARKIDRNHT